MLSHAQEAIAISAGRAREDLDTDRLLNLALVRLMEIVGESAMRVSAAGRESMPSIPWPEIVGLRNRLIHGYDAVDFDILWAIIQADLPPLVQALQQALDRH